MPRYRTRLAIQNCLKVFQLNKKRENIQMSKEIYYIIVLTKAYYSKLLLEKVQED